MRLKNKRHRIEFIFFRHLFTSRRISFCSRFATRIQNFEVFKQSKKFCTACVLDIDLKGMSVDYVTKTFLIINIHEELKSDVIPRLSPLTENKEMISSLFFNNFSSLIKSFLLFEWEKFQKISLRNFPKCHHDFK